MKSRKKLVALAQLVVGLGLIVLLICAINKQTQKVEFTVPSSSVDEDAVYETAGTATNTFLVLEAVENTTQLTVVRVSQKKGSDIPESGVLNLVQGNGPQTISWSERRVSQAGLRLIGHFLAKALKRWPFLIMGFLCFFGCLCIGIIRWYMILEAQGLRLSLGRTCCIFFIGHFFNSFMPGITGGDVIKAYYAAKETMHKKTEAVSTVFVDRVIGIMALMTLGLIMMLVRFRLFLANAATRTICFIMIAMIAGSAVFLVLLFSRNLFERWAWLQKAMGKLAFGSVVVRAYNAFYLYRCHPVLLLKTFGLSLVNHLFAVTGVACFGTSLRIALPFMSYLTLFPTINALAAVPITQGGLGIREYLVIQLLGGSNVPSMQAFLVSLMGFFGLMAWGAIGGVIFLFYTSGAGHSLRDEMKEIEKESAS